MAKNRIHAKGDYNLDEKIASVIIQPGMLVEIEPNTVNLRPHNVEGGETPEAAFAAEDALQGKTVTDNYAIGGLVTYLLPVKGGCVNALLKAGYDYTIGTKLVSDGDGTLIPNGEESSAGPVPSVVGVNTEDCDISASGSANTLCEIRII